MDKLLKAINLDFLKGSRTKLCLIVAGLLGIVVQLGWLNQAQADTVIKLGVPFGLYFAVEHWSPKV